MESYFGSPVRVAVEVKALWEQNEAGGVRGKKTVRQTNHGEDYSMSSLPLGLVIDTPHRALIKKKVRASCRIFLSNTHSKA